MIRGPSKPLTLSLPGSTPSSGSSHTYALQQCYPFLPSQSILKVENSVTKQQFCGSGDFVSGSFPSGLELSPLLFLPPSKPFAPPSWKIDLSLETSKMKAACQCGSQVVAIVKRETEFIPHPWEPSHSWPNCASRSSWRAHGTQAT